MGIVKFLKRSLVGMGGLLAISASSAVNEAPQHAAALPSLAATSAWLQHVENRLEGMLSPTKAATTDPVWMALLALACMAVVVKRRGSP